MVSNVRFRALGLISGAVTINYLDRALLGVATPLLRSEFSLNAVQLGWLLSAFSWTYFLSQLPVGVLLDRFRVGSIYVWSLLAWSMVTLLHSVASGLAILIVLRLALGVAEAPCFPANNKVVSAWFPRQERARAISVYTAAEYVGLSFLSPLLYLIQQHFGWRALFAVAGGVGVTYGVMFMHRYRDPQEHAGVSPQELAYIEAGGGNVQPQLRVPFRLGHIAELFRHRQMWGLCIGQFAVYATFVFFLTWFPSYLASERHMGWIKVGIYSALPYIAGFCGILFAGWWSDTMLRRGVSLSTARKLPVIAGLIGASTIMCANFVHNNALVVAILSFAFFSQAMSSSGGLCCPKYLPSGS